MHNIKINKIFLYIHCILSILLSHPLCYSHIPLLEMMSITTLARMHVSVYLITPRAMSLNLLFSHLQELSRYISVDIYGACGRKKCPRSSSSRCFDMLNKDYKFYLAFENSNCRDYITEKFFVNGLRWDIFTLQ